MPWYNQPREAWQYANVTNVIKVKAVTLSLQDDKQVKQIAEGLGMPINDVVSLA